MPSAFCPAGTHRTGRKEIIFKEGIIVRGSLAAGGGNAVVHTGARAGQVLCHVEAPTTIGQEKSDTVITMMKAPQAQDANIGMKNSIVVNYANDATTTQEGRRTFLERMQREGESAKNFAEDLERLASKCGITHIEDELTMKFIGGLQNPKIKEKLQGCKDLTFQRAKERAEDMESMF